MKPDIEELRRKYINNPPEGLTPEDIRRMSEGDLLDMDYFLNEDQFEFRCIAPINNDEEEPEKPSKKTKKSRNKKQ